MKKELLVGVLGGMSLAATARFLTYFVEELGSRGYSQDGEFPQMVIYSLPLTDWDELGASDHVMVSRQVCDGIGWLIQQGCNLIAVPCNSVHQYYKDFPAYPRVEVLNICEETLNRTKGVSLGVLCSKQSKEAHLYRRGNKHVIYSDYQDKIDVAIADVVRGFSPNIDDVCNDLLSHGSEEIVLGCTDLSCCVWSENLPVVDSARCLAQALAGKIEQ